MFKAESDGSICHILVIVISAGCETPSRSWARLLGPILIRSSFVLAFKFFELPSFD